MMTVPDRLLGMIELYAADRVEEKRLRREMRALRCEVDPDGDRCYLSEPSAADCAPCRKRRDLWPLFVLSRAANRNRLRKIERLALRLSMPEPPEPEEPKPLLDIIEADGGGR